MDIGFWKPASPYCASTIPKFSLLFLENPSLFGNLDSTLLLNFGGRICQWRRDGFSKTQNWIFVVSSSRRCIYAHSHQFMKALMAGGTTKPPTNYHRTRFKWPSEPVETDMIFHFESVVFQDGGHVSRIVWSGFYSSRRLDQLVTLSKKYKVLHLID